MTMTTTNATQISRRNVMTSGGVAGFGIAGLGIAATANARTASIPALAGSVLDLTKPSDALFARVRLLGNVDQSARRFDWFDGVVTGIAPDGHAVPFAALRGHIETRLAPLTDHEGWQRNRKIAGTYYDLATEVPLKEFLNPFTGDRIDVPPFRVEASDVVDGEQAPVWWQEGDQIIMEDSEAFDYLGAGAVAFTSRVASLRDLHDLTLTAVPELGTWTITGGWPDWLQMDRTPGHCLIQCKRGGGANRISGLPS